MTQIAAQGSGMANESASSGYIPNTLSASIRDLMIRIGFWGPLYCTYNKEPPK